MKLPIRFPSDVEVITEEVARFRRCRLTNSYGPFAVYSQPVRS